MAGNLGKKRTERNIRVRKRTWPDLDEAMLWNWKVRGGFTTVPRTMPYFGRVMDDLSKAKPLFSTYFALWCRMWDESCLVRINNPTALARESGFSGQRAVSTWRSRMKTLVKLGFIKHKPLDEEPYGYVLVINPYYAVKRLVDSGEYGDEGWYNALWERHDAIGATDLDDLVEAETESEN
jgi:hypothetical protein